jgi:hypothetical protein
VNRKTQLISEKLVVGFIGWRWRGVGEIRLAATSPVVLTAHAHHLTTHAHHRHAEELIGGLLLGVG